MTLTLFTTDAEMKARVEGHLPNGTIIKQRVTDWRGLNLVGAYRLERMPEGLRLDGCAVHIEGACITGFTVMLHQSMPHTVAAAAVGRKLGEVVHHRLLEGHSHSKAVIVEILQLSDCTVLLLDRIFGQRTTKARKAAEVGLLNYRFDSDLEAKRLAA